MRTSTKSKKRSSLIDDTPSSKSKKRDKKTGGKEKTFSGKTRVFKSILLGRKNALNIGVMSFPDSDAKFVDIRKYFLSAGDEFLPTGKGVSISVNHIPALIQTLKKIAKKYPAPEEADDNGED